MTTHLTPGCYGKDREGRVHGPMKEGGGWRFLAPGWFNGWKASGKHLGCHGECDLDIISLCEEGKPVDAPGRVGEAKTTRTFWVVERFEDGKSRGYWDGGSSRSFVADIDEAVHFCRKADAFWTSRGWHWNDIQLTEHKYIERDSAAPLLATEREKALEATLAALQRRVNKQCEAIKRYQEEADARVLSCPDVEAAAIVLRAMRVERYALHTQFYGLPEAEKEVYRKQAADILAASQKPQPSPGIAWADGAGEVESGGATIFPVHGPISPYGIHVLAVGAGEVKGVVG